jgi:hypothetical protein
VYRDRWPGELARVLRANDSSDEAGSHRQMIDEPKSFTARTRALDIERATIKKPT